MSFCFLSPGAFTGGPMALHQAASAMNAMGGHASVMYITDKELGARERAFACADGTVRMRKGLRQARPDKRLGSFGVPAVETAPRDTHFVVPEAWPDMASALLNHGCPNVYLWWLSVDNFPLSKLKQLVNQRLIRECHNLCQSAYAAEFVKHNGARRASMLSDFIDLDAVADPRPVSGRRYDLAYLPAKARGAEPLLTALEAHYDIVALRDMSRAQIVETLSDCKIFLDCGNHPGKDRVPREAALCGCLPLVRHEGAARYAEDVPLPADLLVETEAFFDPAAMRARIDKVLDAPERYAAEMAAYRRRIAGERAVFEAELQHLIALDA